MPSSQPQPDSQTASAPANPTAGALLVATSPTNDAAEPLLWRTMHRQAMALWSLSAFANYLHPRSDATSGFPAPLLTGIVILARHNRATEAQKLASLARAPAWQSLIRVILSAAEWHATLAAGLAALPQDCDWIIVQDALRPLVDRIDPRLGLRAALAADGVALACEPITDTLKRVADGRVVETLPRANLRRLETPLVIRRDVLARALQSAPENAGLVEIARASGARVALYTPIGINPAVTNEADWVVAESVLKQRVYYPFLAEDEKSGLEIE